MEKPTDDEIVRQAVEASGLGRAVPAALEYANDPAHGNRGYTLRVTFTDGTELEGPVIAHNGAILVLKVDEAFVFCDTNHVSSVEVLW